LFAGTTFYVCANKLNSRELQFPKAYSKRSRGVHHNHDLLFRVLRLCCSSWHLFWPTKATGLLTVVADTYTLV